MVTTWPKNFPGTGDAALRLAQSVEAMSGGAIRIKVFSDGELAPAFGAFDAVAQGSADMYHGAEYYWEGKNRGFSFFTSVPFGMTAPEIMGWIDFGGGQELWNELSAQFGVIAFQAANTGHQMGGWFRREINSLADFRGLKMRIPGLGGEVVQRLGGAKITIPGQEIFQALQTGAIDATEWIGPWNDLAFGFHQVAKNYYGPGFHEPGSTLSLGVNLAKWQSFTAEEQAMIRAAAAQVNHLSLGEFTYRNGLALETLKRDHAVIVRQFPADVLEAAAKAASEALAEAGASDPLAERIYQSYKAARAAMRGWTEIGEGPFYAARTGRP